MEALGIVNPFVINIIMITENIKNILQSKKHNSFYLDRYINFLSKINNDESTNKYLENHHICPKAPDLFPEYSSFKKYPWNKIKLTARQHFIAHHILWKSYGGSQIFSFYSMSHQKNSNKNHKEKYVKLNSKQFSILREAYAEIRKQSLEERYGVIRANEIKEKRLKSFKPRYGSLEKQYGSEKAKEIKNKKSKALKGKTYEELFKDKDKIINLKKTRGKYLKNKTMIECFGIEKALEIKKKRSEKRKLWWKNKINSSF